MGTYTVDGHFYKPVAHESNYETLVNLNWDVLGKLDSGVANVMDPQFAGGAKGDGTTDDSAAIQAAIDSNATTVYFPGVLTHYAIGTPLVPLGGQKYLGDGGTYEGYGSSASRLKTKGSNHVIWAFGPTCAGYNTWEGLVFQGTVQSLSDLTVAFEISGTYMAACRFVRCIWNWTKYAIDTGSTGWFLSNWLEGCDFESAPTRLGTGVNQYMNNNHWNACKFHASTWTVPYVEITAGNPAAGNWFTDCYFESLKRQAIRVSAPWGFGVHNSYFEAINDSSTTYTAQDGRVAVLPAIDLCNVSGVAPGGACVIEGNTFVLGNLALNYGSTVYSHADYIADLTFKGNFATATDGTRGWWDASNIRRVHGPAPFPQATFNETGGVPRQWGPGNMPGFDALVAETWVLQGDDTTAFTIPNPMSPTEGRRLRIVLYDSGGSLGTVSWGSAFQFANGVAPPHPPAGTKLTIDFEFVGTINVGAGIVYSATAATSKWVEVFRSPTNFSGTATWNPASLATGATATTTVTVTGAAVGDVASAGFSVAVPAGMLLTASVTAANTVTVTLYNVSATNPTDLASGTLTARVWRN